MTPAFTIQVTAPTVLAALEQLKSSFTPSKMRPAMREIGEEIVERTMRRFDTSTAPDGTPWAPLAEGTVLARLAKIMGVTHKDNERNRKREIAGKLNDKGVNEVTGMKPLIDSGNLKRQIRYRIINGGAGVAIGTERFADEWEGGAAVHQFGTTNAGKKHNITIPARPFLGLSASDETFVIDIINKFIAEAAQNH